MKVGFTTLLIFSITALVLAVPASAQMRISPGVKAGINISNLYGDDVNSPDSKVGFVAGGFVSIGVSELFAVQPEIFYSQKGAKDTVADTEITTRLDYIEIPVLAKLSFPTESTVTPVFFAGPAVGIEASAKAKSDGDEADIEDTKSTEFGLVVGGGAQLAVGDAGGAVTADVRYVLGLTSIDDSSEELDVKNGTISLLVGYAFM